MKPAFGEFSWGDVNLPRKNEKPKKNQTYNNKKCKEGATMYSIQSALLWSESKATFTPDSRPTPDQCRPIFMAWSGMIG